MASSGTGLYISNKPVVRVSAVAAKRPLSQASDDQQAYHMIQIGDEIFKVGWQISTVTVVVVGTVIYSLSVHST